MGNVLTMMVMTVRKIHSGFPGRRACLTYFVAFPGPGRHYSSEVSKVPTTWGRQIRGAGVGAAFPA